VDYAIAPYKGSLWFDGIAKPDEVACVAIHHKLSWHEATVYFEVPSGPAGGNVRYDPTRKLVFQSKLPEKFRFLPEPEFL
jgi:hypothetical protein